MPSLQPFLPFICLALAVVVIAEAIFLVGLNRQFARHTQMLRQFFSGANGEDLESLLRANVEASRESQQHAAEALAQAQAATLQLSSCIQHFSLLRYDAFDDVTGQQSFSVALLDGQDNGAIITALFGRSNSRCFGKMIVAGEPEQPLTNEEQQVLLTALEKKVHLSDTKAKSHHKNGKLNGQLGSAAKLNGSSRRELAETGV